MTNTKTGGRKHVTTTPNVGGDAARGWYLYGIARRLPLAAVLADTPDAFEFDGSGADDDAAPLQLLEYAGVVAIVRPVLLADYSSAAVQERVRTVEELETMVRGHHRIIEAIHAQQVILPAKFGMVYTHARDIVSALRSAHAMLIREIDRLEGCDEWAVHLYADRGAVRERISATDIRIRRMRKESSGMRPGLAFFLEKQLRDQLEVATREALVTLAQKTYERLLGHAVAGQVNPVGPAGEQTRDVEILRASFLVTRERTDHFMEEVRSNTDAADGLRCEWSGPWPPYSFAAGNNEDA